MQFYPSSLHSALLVIIQKLMKKWEVFENILVEKLVFWGKGFARVDGKVVFITGWAIPWSRVNLRILKKRKDFFETQITEVLQKSPIETGSYELFPGAPWINIDYQEQLKIKQTQIEESFFHIRKYQEHIDFLPIIGAPDIFGYRNKIEFSFGKYISHREEKFEDFNIGFHARGDFSRVEDYSECLLIDAEQNQIYQRVREYTKSSGLPVYDAKTQVGFWRHLLIRKTYFTSQTLLVFSFFPSYFEDEGEKEKALENLTWFCKKLSSDFPSLSSIYFSYNNNKADILIGEKMQLIYGEATVTEKLLGLDFDISPQSFFQTNSRGAEILYWVVRDFVHSDTFSTATILDLYAGTGTIGMILASKAEKVISVELIPEASKNGEENAKKNHISHIEFVNEKVEDFLKQYLQDGMKADLLVIDPPRAGMHPDTLPSVLKFGTQQILYVSCNPATLARDLQYILENSDYKLEKVQAVDMFPHTHHIETVVSLIKKEAV